MKNLSSYYPQANGQVEGINKVLKTILRRMVGDHKSNWHLILFSSLSACRTSVEIAIGFTTFHLVYGLKVVLLIQCHISSLQLVFKILPNTSTEEEIFLYLSNLDETHRYSTLANDAHKKCIKA